MNQQSYFSVESPGNYQFVQNGSSSPPDDSFLDDLLHQKSRIFASKLEVLAAAMIVRIGLLTHNLERIESDCEHIQSSLDTLDRQARYHLREHRDKNVLYQTLFRLEEERRSQGVECWRDIFDVLREFLVAWEAHQQSQGRAIFLNHVGE